MNYSKFISLIGGVDRTVDLSLTANILELGGGGLQMNGSTSGHVVLSASPTTTTYSLIWPATQSASAGYVLSNDGTGHLNWVSASAGSVTSVALALPASVFTVSGSPVTSSGTLTGTLNTQSANTVWAGPVSGGALAPAFRTLVSADIPNNAANTTGTAANITATSNATLTSLSALTTASSLSTIGTITAGIWQGTIVGVPYGGTGVSAVTTAPTPTAWAGWDANKNLSANNLISGFTSTPTAAANTTLTVASTCQQTFTGNSTQTVLLPVVSTLVAGQSFIITNLSTGTVSVQSSGSNSLQVMGPSTQLVATCLNVSGTSAASWIWAYVPAQSTSLSIAQGGTGATTAASAFQALSPLTTAGDIIFENSTPAPARLPIGTNGQILTVVSGLPAWSTTVSPSNTSLSNLSAVAINTSLLPGADNTINLGSTGFSWAAANIHNLVDGSAIVSANPYTRTLADSTGLASVLWNARTLQDTSATSSIDWQNRRLQDTASAIQLSWSTAGVVFNQLTASTVPYLNASKVLTSSAVLPTELGYLSGVTSAIQTQLNAKTTSTLAGANIFVGNASSVATAVAVSGDLTLANTGAFTVAKIQGVTVSGITGTGNVVFSATPTFTGTLTAAASSFTGAMNLNSNGISNLSSPVNPNDAANKSYVDNLSNGTSWKNEVLVATTANITLSGEQTIDGFLTSASRVLVKNQTTAANNGIYNSSSGAWARTADMNTWAQVPGAAMFVQEGTVNGDIGFICTSQPGGTLGTTAITFVQFSSAGSYTADGVTLQIVSGVFSIKNAGVTETQIASTALSSTGALVGGSGTKISANVDNTTIAITANAIGVKSAGISATQLSTGAFDQVTIIGGAGTPAYIASTPSLSFTGIAGQALAANSTYAVRFGMPANSETAGRIYGADITTSSFDLFWVVGFVQTTASVAIGGTVSIVQLGSLTLKSADTLFGANDPGKPVFLQAGGLNANTTPPSTSGQAVAKLGIVISTTSFLVQISSPNVA